MQLVQTAQNRDEELGRIVQENIPNLTPLEKQYQGLHRDPKLGKQESRTASIATTDFKSLGFAHESVGESGLVTILKNGLGPIILLTDMDGLVVKEETSLPYASHAYQKNDAGDYFQFCTLAVTISVSPV